MYPSTFLRLAWCLAFAVSISVVKARPVIQTTSPIEMAQPDSGTCEMAFIPHHHRIEEHGEILYHEARNDRVDDSNDLRLDRDVGCDPAIVINASGFGAGDLDYIEELEQEREHWVADQVYMRQADAILALQDEHLWNDFAENNHGIGYLDRTRQIIQGLICLLPDKAKHYTTCPKSA
ncbi:uncharacterized protein V1513DRAFT_440249 [Lipomyces chichibuensis]|uniref:uncharacterized protein n=1 Tax=Lipomyces chichibuensis TaxID=1546026 RepID=UPI00334364C1